MFKLSPLTYVVVGVVLAASIFLGFWFMKIAPGRQEIAYWSDHNAKLDEIISEPSKRAAAERVRQALSMVRDAETSWKLIAQRRTPSSGQMNLVPHRWQNVVNARRWHGRVEADLRKWMSQSSVRLVDPPLLMIPFPTDQPNQLVQYYFNYPAFPFPIGIWDLGTVTVEGTYDQITNHVRNWSNIPNYIASVRGLSLQGTGNRLRGTYGLTLIAYVNTEYISGGPGAGGTVPDLNGEGDSGTMTRQGGGGPTGGGGGGGPAPSGGGTGRASAARVD